MKRIHRSSTFSYAKALSILESSLSSLSENIDVHDEIVGQSVNPGNQLNRDDFSASTDSASPPPT